MRLLALRLFAAGAATGVVCSMAEAAESMVSLFNGRDLTGWIQRGGKASYVVEEGALVGRSAPHTPNSFLCTTRSYTNFILELEFKVATNLNSGVQIRSECFDEAREVVVGGKTLKIPAGRVHGYQIEIDPSPRAWTGGVFDESRRGWLADLKSNEAARTAFRPGDWNAFRIEANGDVLKTWLNGVLAARLQDGLTPAGFIGLQVHGVKARTEPLEIRWRNIRLRELP